MELKQQIIPLLNQVTVVEKLKDVTLVWIEFRGGEEVYGFKDFDYWTDAQKHLEKVQEHVNFKSTSYYLYMKGRDKPVIQIHARQRQFAKWDQDTRRKLQKLLT